MTRLRMPYWWLGLLIVTGCSSSDRTTAPTNKPEFAISDAVHEGGTQGFYFLPPMVAQPAFSGTFDADITTLKPAIAICDVTNGPDNNCGNTGGTPAVVVFTTASQPAITVDLSTPQYQVNWDTQGAGFVTAHTYRVHVTAGASGSRRELGFADVLLTTTPGQVKQLATGDLIVLQDGRTLPIHFRIETGIPGNLAVSAASAFVTTGATDVITATVADLRGTLFAGAAVTWGVTTTPATGVADATQPLNPTSGQTGSIGTTVTTFKAGTAAGTAIVTAASAGLSATVSVGVQLPGINEFSVSTPGSSPIQITAGPDGALWFTEFVGNKIGRITTSGVVTNEFPIPTAGSNPYRIAVGPDGALWFTEINANQIGRITTVGAITEFSIPTAGSVPLGIAAGPDGAMWFTEDNAGKIGRITTAGVVTSEFSILTANSTPREIVAGPDGALWFIEDGAMKVGQITTAGVITEFGVASAGFPHSIAVGPDAALWFTGALGNNIGRITTAGTVTNEFPLPTPGSFPEVITEGPDGALWFTENNGNRIGRLSTSGVFTEFPVPTAASTPFGIVAGPDGALWFAESNANKIGRVGP